MRPVAMDRRHNPYLTQRHRLDAVTNRLPSDNCVTFTDRQHAEIGWERVALGKNGTERIGSVHRRSALASQD